MEINKKANPRPTLKNAPRSFNTLQEQVDKVVRRAWRTAAGERPSTTEIQQAAEIHVADLDARNVRKGRGSMPNQKRTIMALVVGAEYAIANWQEADRTGAWPMRGFE